MTPQARFLVLHKLFPDNAEPSTVKPPRHLQSAKMPVISVTNAVQKVATLENGLEDISEKTVQTENNTLVFVTDNSSKVCGDVPKTADRSIERLT